MVTNVEVAGPNCAGHHPNEVTVELHEIADIFSHDRDQHAQQQNGLARRRISNKSQVKYQASARVWQTHEGQHKFLLNGRFMYGPSIRNAVFTLSVTNFLNIFSLLWFLIVSEFLTICVSNLNDFHRLNSSRGCSMPSAVLGYCSCTS